MTNSVAVRIVGFSHSNNAADAIPPPETIHP